MGYIVQVLSDKEFDQLPYKRARTSLGCADPEKNMAFVRETGVKELDMATLQHEVDELAAKVSPHEEDGIRYKSGGSLGRILAPVLGGLVTVLSGGTLAPLGVAIGSAGSVGTSQYSKAKKPEKYGQPGQIGDILGSALTGGAGAYGAGQLGLGGVAGGTQAAPGFLSKAAGITKGALLGTPAAIGGPATTSFGVPVGSTFTPPTSGLLGTGGAIGGAGTKASQAAGAKWAAPTITKGFPSPIAPASSFVPSTVPGPQGGNILGQTQGKTPTALPALTGPPGVSPAVAPGIAPVIPGVSPAAKPFSFQDLITGPNIMGAASLLGGAGLGTPEFKMPDTVEQLRAKIMEGQGLSPLGQQAQSELANILGSQPSQINAPAGDEYYAATNRQIDLQYDNAKASLDAAYNNAGMLNSGEHLGEVRKLEEARANAKSAFVVSENQRRFEYGSSQKYNAIQSALGVDRNVMDDLVGLTGLDVTTAAIIYGANAADITAIREALGTLGSELLLRGQGVQGSQQAKINPAENVLNLLGVGGG